MKKIVFIIILAAFLSGCATTMYPSPADRKEGIYHKVGGSETLCSISKAYNVSVENIVNTNNLPDADSIEAGQLIFIPGVKKR